MMTAEPLTRIEALRILSKQDETPCDVLCLPDSVVACVGNQWLEYEELEAMKREGLVTIRLEYIPHAPMGPRTPPIRHVSLTDAGRAAIVAV